MYQGIAIRTRYYFGWHKEIALAGFAMAAHFPLLSLLAQRQGLASGTTPAREQ
jgi:hypothetical protein